MRLETYRDIARSSLVVIICGGLRDGPWKVEGEPYIVEYIQILRLMDQPVWRNRGTKCLQGNPETVAFCVFNCQTFARTGEWCTQAYRAFTLICIEKNCRKEQSS